MSADSMPVDRPATTPAAGPAARRPPGGRLRLRIATGLVLAFGGLVALAVASVLALGLWSARQNTIELTRGQAAAILAVLHGRIEDHLRPAEMVLDGFARQIEAGSLDPEDIAGLRAHMAGIMTGAPQLASLIHFWPDGRMARMIRLAGSLDMTVASVGSLPVVRRLLDGAARRNGTYWGDIVRPPEEQAVLVNVRRPVRPDGRFAGALVATVQIGDLSRLLHDSSGLLTGEAFVIDAARRVIAHRSLTGGYKWSTPDKPLPQIDEIRDPVLSAYVRPERHLDRGTFARQTGVTLVATETGDEYAVIAEQILGFAEQPWFAGVYFRIEEVNAAFLRLVWAGVAGLVVLVLALLVAWGVARYLSRPVLLLAAAARRVRHLELDGVRPLPRSRFRELDEAGRAFNAMVMGLRWFETYVPRQLVHRLVRQGAGGPPASERRELTVLFTDIVGFTTISESLTAEQTADFLNRHFADLAACVEAEGGTIDKFIGDSLMAFWGAPQTDPGHALGAVRAALAIRAAMAEANRARIAAGQPPVALRIGLHSGAVVVGNIGAPGRINYTIVGDDVNVANRLEQMGKEVPPRPADRGVVILASERTVAAAGGAAPAEPLGEMSVRGRSRAVVVYRL